MSLSLRAAELVRARLPFVAPFRSLFGTQQERELLLVRLITDGPDGWGECAAPDRPGYTSEFVEGARAVIRDRLLPPLFAAGFVDAASLPSQLARVPGHPMSRAAVEMAVLDAVLRADGQSLGAHLGAIRSEVPCGVVIGFASSIGELLDEAGRRLEEGYLRVKLKIRPGWDLEPVAALRARFPLAVLAADANGAYTLGDATRLAQLDAHGLAMLEQPLAAASLEEHAALSKRIRTPVCLDESIDSLETARKALDLGACSIVNAKPSRVGGIAEAAALLDLCRQAGAEAWCGGMFDAGLGRAANLALAALPGVTMPNDLSPTGRHFAREVTSPPAVMHDGRITVPLGPGLGVEVDEAALAEVTTQRELIRP